MLTYTKIAILVIQYLLLTLLSKDAKFCAGLLELVDPLLQVDICDNSPCYQVISHLWDRGDSAVQPVG